MTASKPESILVELFERTLSQQVERKGGGMEVTQEDLDSLKSIYSQLFALAFSRRWNEERVERELEGILKDAYDD